MINYSLLSNTILFRGIAPEEIASMLKCLGGKTKHFQKDSVIYPAGGFAKAMGVVLSGGVNIEPVSYTHLDVYKRQGQHRKPPC